MKVLVDTSIWSLALRRQEPSQLQSSRLVLDLEELILDVRVAIIGPIRQELLSGITRREQFELLREKLRAFDDLPLIRADFETAAEFYNTCCGSGVQGSHVDFLICAAAANRSMPIFTTDKDFTHYAQYLPINLHQ